MEFKIKKGILGGFLASVHCTSVIRLTFQHKLSQNCSELIFLSFFTHLRSSSSSSLYQGRGEVGPPECLILWRKPCWATADAVNQNIDAANPKTFLVNYGKQTNENFEMNTRLVISSQLRSCATYQLSFPERSQTLWEWECPKKVKPCQNSSFKVVFLFKI